jgi:hypothetical protein
MAVKIVNHEPINTKFSLKNHTKIKRNYTREPKGGNKKPRKMDLDMSKAETEVQKDTETDSTDRQRDS